MEFSQETCILIGQKSSTKALKSFTTKSLGHTVSDEKENREMKSRVWGSCGFN